MNFLIIQRDRFKHMPFGALAYLDLVVVREEDGGFSIVKNRVSEKTGEATPGEIEFLLRHSQTGGPVGRRIH